MKLPHLHRLSISLGGMRSLATTSSTRDQYNKQISFSVRLAQRKGAMQLAWNYTSSAAWRESRCGSASMLTGFAACRAERYWIRLRSNDFIVV